MVTLNSHAETFYYYRDMKNQLTTKIIHDIKQYDVSLLLNAHDELLFIDKTLLSLSYDLKVAQENEISVEFVIVLDRSSNEFYNRICFLLKKLGLSAKVIRVNYGSLGASRNLGIRNCSGKYICVADADDLTSSNCLTQMFKTITYLEGTGEVVAVFPEYVWNFGANNFVTRKLDSRFYQLKDWACIHPFCSKIMIKRSFLQYRGYQSYDKDSPFEVSKLVLKNSLLINLKDEELNDWDNFQILRSAFEIHNKKARVQRDRPIYDSLTANVTNVRLI